MRILFTSGGSGGHIFPLIAVARQLKKIYNYQGGTESLEMFFLGPDGSAFENFKTENIEVKNLASAKFRRYFSILNFLDIFKIPIGFIQALYHLFILMPDVVFSKGGYASIPVVVVAWIYRIPVLIHESDSVPGLANKIASKMAKRVAVSFDSAKDYLPPKKTVLVGNPIREELTEICQQTDESKIKSVKRDMGIARERKVILIIGGSQGAYKINEIILNTLSRMLESYEIIHQCGKKNYDGFSRVIEQTFGKLKNYHLFPFLNQDELARAYLVSDLIISRAGAGSIFEIAACRKPSILIPLPNAANDHQRKNAFTCGRFGMSTVIEQANLTPNIFLNEINKILNNIEIKKKMTQNTRNLYYPKAAQTIAEALVEMAIM